MANPTLGALGKPGPNCGFSADRSRIAWAVAEILNRLGNGGPLREAFDIECGMRITAVAFDYDTGEIWTTIDELTDDPFYTRWV